VRRDNGQKYEDYLKDLAKAAVSRIQRASNWTAGPQAEEEGSNKEWMNRMMPMPIAKMKDGSTHMPIKQNTQWTCRAVRC